MTRVRLLIGTRKGLWTITGDASRKVWKLAGPQFLGQTLHHVVQDPRATQVVLAATLPGHLGGSVFRSADGGRSWTEAKEPPAFPKREGGESVKHVFWLTPGHASQPGVWFAGTAPHGLFRSDDGGVTWSGVKGFNEHPMRDKWRGDPANTPPDSPNTHSILVDPRDPKHMYAGFSAGGVFESIDGGADWKPLNKGCAADFLPDKEAEFGHDPHCVVLHPARPDRLYMQNHCGIYRMDRPGHVWERIGRNMPKAVGDIGFPIVPHPRDPDTCWVFPMDGTEKWPRVSPGGKPAVYVTRNAGKSWSRQDKGFPRSQAWWTVKRQCMCADAGQPAGLYLGTTGGQVWASRDEGASWRPIAEHLPQVTCVTLAR